MLTTSLVGTKVTAATRVQTVKRNATVRAATQKMGAKGKKKGEKVSLQDNFLDENGQRTESERERKRGGEGVLSAFFSRSLLLLLWCSLKSSSPIERKRRGIC